MSQVYTLSLNGGVGTKFVTSISESETAAPSLLTLAVRCWRK